MNLFNLSVVWENDGARYFQTSYCCCTCWLFDVCSCAAFITQRAPSSDTPPQEVRRDRDEPQGKGTAKQCETVECTDTHPLAHTHAFKQTRKQTPSWVSVCAFVCLCVCATAHIDTHRHAKTHAYKHTMYMRTQMMRTLVRRDDAGLFEESRYSCWFQSEVIRCI
jgi:hypothetical protein